MKNDIFNYFSKFWNNLSNNQVKCGKLYLPNSDDYERTINKSILTQCSISILPENVRKPLRFWWVKNWLGTTWWNSDCNVFYFYPHLLPITYLFNCSVKLIFWDIRLWFLDVSLRFFYFLGHLFLKVRYLTTSRSLITA